MVPSEYPFFQRRQASCAGSGGNGLGGFWDDPCAFPELPSRLLEQNFGMGFSDDDLWPATPFRGWYMIPRRQPQQPVVQEQGDHLSGVSEVTNDGKEFKVNLDVMHFRPDEIQVKNVGNRVTVHAKHAERPDEHGFIQREFSRSYVLPKEIDPQTIRSTLSADGVLTIFAPKVSIEDGAQQRMIPIESVASP